jgi:hypothetical protein
LLSEGIVKTDGSRGPNFLEAAQKEAIDTPADEFMLSPRQTGSFTTLPQPSMGLNLLLLPYSLEYRNTVGAWPFSARPVPVASGRIHRALLARPAFERSNEQWALQHNQFQLRLQSLQLPTWLSQAEYQKQHGRSVIMN